jgi:hypothetical protein
MTANATAGAKAAATVTTAPNKPSAAEIVTSQHRGVSWHQTRGKWQARISVDGKIRHLGCFADESEAARAFDAAHRQHGRPEAHCNFKKRKR